MSDQQTYKSWKQAIPFLYDWFANHHLDWPSLCCRWVLRCRPCLLWPSWA